MMSSCACSSAQRGGTRTTRPRLAWTSALNPTRPTAQMTLTSAWRSVLTASLLRMTPGCVWMPVLMAPSLTTMSGSVSMSARPPQTSMVSRMKISVLKSVHRFPISMRTTRLACACRTAHTPSPPSLTLSPGGVSSPALSPISHMRTTKRGLASISAPITTHTNPTLITRHFAVSPSARPTPSITRMTPPRRA